MNFECVKVERKESVQLIALNRPSVRNSLNRQTRLELRTALDEAMADDEVRAIVLTGEGKGFCAGADLAEEIFDNGQPDYLANIIRIEYNLIIRSIVKGNKPVVCAVNGAAVGFGGSLVMACDLVLMAENAFIYPSFTGSGLVADGGFHSLLRNAVGPQKAYEIIVYSQRLDAQKCEQLGIANRIASNESVREEALTLAEQLSHLAPLSLRHSKQVLRKAETENLLTIADREASFQEVNLRSDDHVEGVKAFFEKRSAKFTGR